MKIIQIKNPCEEKWESMQEVQGGKHCNLCDKKVWDLDKLSDSEIRKITKDNLICGKKSFTKPIISSIFFSFNIKFYKYFLCTNTEQFCD